MSTIMILARMMIKINNYHCEIFCCIVIISIIIIAIIRIILFLNAKNVVQDFGKKTKTE